MGFEKLPKYAWAIDPHKNPLEIHFFLCPFFVSATPPHHRLLPELHSSPTASSSPISSFLITFPKNWIQLEVGGG
ncbi:hypothetical protein L6452_35531 [Arctium lappa]|uniref:Uncharacterized protein n=1 Tax=Arctium lappa TaxID=4217 RepID=A0ACB8Y7E2_ARCLA|nr:hypothetical protein L6452_35531 [Arctium lappa]